MQLLTALCCSLWKDYTPKSVYRVVNDLAEFARACYDCPSNATDCLRPDCIPGAGVSRLLAVVNHQLPGPAIQVSELLAVVTSAAGPAKQVPE